MIWNKIVDIPVPESGGFLVASLKEDGSFSWGEVYWGYDFFNRKRLYRNRRAFSLENATHWCKPSFDIYDLQNKPRTI